MRRADTSFRMLPFSSPSLTVADCNKFHHHAPRFGFKHEPFNLRISATSSGPPSTARFMARRRESIFVQQLQKPLSEFMSLPISYDSVLAGEKVEKLDDNTFKCHVYRFNVFTYEICPVLLVRVDHQPNGCRINLLSCKDSSKDHPPWLHKATTLRVSLTPMYSHYFDIDQLMHACETSFLVSINQVKPN